jgi:hypothetical protein
MTVQTSIITGSFVYPAAAGERPASTVDEMEAAVRVLQQHKAEWAGQPIAARLGYLETLIRDFAALSAEWVEQVTAAQQIDGNDHAIGTEWMQGPYSVLRNLQCLRQSFQEIQAIGYPKIPGKITTRPNGQVSAQVFPQTFYDKVLFSGYRVEVWMEAGVTLENLRQTQALAHRSTSKGQVSLVLGAGNLAGIPVTDALDRLFVQNQVVTLKMNPANDYMGMVFERGFHCLIEAGYLQILYGGANEGTYLCQHPGVDEIFVTGSDKTFDAIVFGPGEVGARRKAEHQRLLDKPVMGELGNVTPAIIVPGVWTQDDLDYQAENLASWLMGNASSACNTPRVIILHAEWPQRTAFLDALRRVYAQTPLRCAFYPGSEQRYQAFMDAHPNAEQIGNPREGELPWTIIPKVSSEKQDDICFTTEAFCSVAAVTPISAASVPEYLERTVTFANQTLWGTLAAGIFIHPTSMQDPQIKTAVEGAIEKLRYGTIGVNCAAGLSWVMMTTPWGAFPGSDVFDIQSGNSFVHNTLMFSKPQKTVVYAKFRESPKPIAFASRGKVIRQMGPLLVDLMAKPGVVKLSRVVRTAFG